MFCTLGDRTFCSRFRFAPALKSDGDRSQLSLPLPTRRWVYPTVKGSLACFLPHLLDPSDYWLGLNFLATWTTHLLLSQLKQSGDSSAGPPLVLKSLVGLPLYSWENTLSVKCRPPGLRPVNSQRGSGWPGLSTTEVDAGVVMPAHRFEV
jgi:hypothetical protein